MRKIKLPKGFLAGGLHCGVKKKRKDLALFYSVKRCKVAALFTRNLVKAAPVIVAQKQLKKKGFARAVLVNSGNANCMTGRRGVEDAKKMAKTAAKLLKVPADEVLVSSTGIIGKFMPMKPIIKGVKELVDALSPYGLINAADGIMTTDRFRKIVTRTFTAGGKKVVMTGVAKGAGMIEPNMATMLCYVLTDLNITSGALKKALKSGTEVSFNSITVDGDMSTNDTVMVLANGEAGNRAMTETGRDFAAARKNLAEILTELARMIVRDGEGASKFIEVNVYGARTDSDAKKIAMSIADSLLVKCAVLGEDPNWGRVGAAAGSSGAFVDPERMEITLDGVKFFSRGKAANPSRKKKAHVFKKKNSDITVNLNAGKGAAAFFSCDISKKYIAFNAHYSS